MRRNRWLVVVLALAAPAMLFAAGGVESPTATGPGFNATGLPIAKSPVTLTMMTNAVAMTPDHNTLPMFIDLEERTNVHVEWEQVRSGWNEKKSLVLASGDLPDAFFGMLTVSDTDILTNLPFFVPLNDLIAKYGPHIERMFDEVPLTEKMARMPDGNIYGLPQTRFANPSH